MRRFKLKRKETADDPNNTSSVILGATVSTRAIQLVAKDAVSTFTAPESGGTLSPGTTCFILLDLNGQNANDYPWLQGTTSDVERKAARFGKSMHTGKRRRWRCGQGLFTIF